MKTTMKTSELTGAALDWAVAKCEGFDTRNNYRCQVIDSDDVEYIFECFADDDEHAEEQALDAYPNSEVHLIEYIGVYSPSTDWAHGGPIIEREKISVSAWGLVNWKALTLRYPQDVEEEFTAFGETPLIAAMRCYVASKLGNEVEIPKELRS